jgi:serine/threonine-protein kinase RsbW
MTQRFSITTSSHPDRLCDIADFVESAACECGLDENQVCDVQMAVDEACSNIIEHAYHGKPDGKIDLVCERRGDKFIVTIQDLGDRFDPNKVPPPKTRGPLSCRRVGGFGLFFMRKLMDKVTFDFSPKQGNRLTMVKKIK